MRKRPFLLGISFVVIAIGTISISAGAQGQTSSVPVTITVTALGPKFSAPPPLTKEDFQAFTGKTRLNVTGWTKALGQSPKSTLQLAVVIDNSDGSIGVGSEIDELATFITSRSKTTAVGLFYAVNGTVEAAAPFGTDHEAVAKELRLPMGRGSGTSPSIYLSLDSLVSHWPLSTPGRREVLLLASGVDHLYPGLEDPYLQAAIQHAQQAGVIVHTIFLSGVRFDETFRGDIAQGNLSQLSDGSGGYAFSEDLNVLLSFAPYLQDTDLTLHNQYLLTFTIDRSKQEKGELRPIQLRTEQRGVDLLYQKQVFVPGLAK